MIAPTLSPDAIVPVSKIQNNKQQQNNDPFISDSIQKVRAMLYENNSLQINTRAMNLVLLAETALSNGNPYAAQDFAERAIQIVFQESEIKPKTKTSEKIKNNKTENNVHEKTAPEKKHESAIHIYKDVSNDAGVSFTYASPLTGPESFFAVPAHEGEHVARRVGEAMMKGDQIMVFVSYNIRYDPETGEPYMAGGETWSITFSHLKPKDNETHAGKMVDTYV